MLCDSLVHAAVARFGYNLSRSFTLSSARRRTLTRFHVGAGGGTFPRILLFFFSRSDDITESICSGVIGGNEAGGTRHAPLVSRLIPMPVKFEQCSKGTISGALHSLYIAISHRLMPVDL